MTLPKIVQILLIGATACSAVQVEPMTPAQMGALSDELDELVTAWHLAAHNADADAYFGTMAEDSIFLGTDASERWTRSEFEKLYRPYFEKGKAWSFDPVQRHFRIGDHGKTAWFDERLHTEKMGECRGSGMLIRTEHGWRIAAYNLTVPIPNPLLPDVVKQIAAAASQDPIPEP